MPHGLTKDIIKLISSNVSSYGETMDGRSCGCGGCIVEEQTQVAKQIEIAELLGEHELAQEIKDDYFD